MEETLYDKIAGMLDKTENVDYSIQLPETEYDVMEAIWNGSWPLTTGYLMQAIGNNRNWKTPTLISFPGEAGRKRIYCFHKERQRTILFSSGGSAEVSAGSNRTVHGKVSPEFLGFLFECIISRRKAAG